MVINNERKNYSVIFKKLKNWFVFYSLGLFIFIGMVIGIFFILNWGHNIVNLTETIQFIVILSPFIILYIQYIKEKKARNERLRILIERIMSLMSDIYEQRGILKGFHERNKFIQIFGVLGKLNLRTEERYLVDIIKLHISHLRTFNLSELAKIKCHFDDPMNYRITILSKYQIGLSGIRNIVNNEELTEDIEKIKEVYFELKERVK
jgi:hypothetical protein